MDGCANNRQRRIDQPTGALPKLKVSNWIEKRSKAKQSEAKQIEARPFPPSLFPSLPLSLLPSFLPSFSFASLRPFGWTRRSYSRLGHALTRTHIHTRILVVGGGSQTRKKGASFSFLPSPSFFLFFERKADLSGGCREAGEKTNIADTGCAQCALCGTLSLSLFLWKKWVSEWIKYIYIYIII